MLSTNLGIVKFFPIFTADFQIISPFQFALSLQPRHYNERRLFSRKPTTFTSQLVRRLTTFWIKTFIKIGTGGVLIKPVIIISTIKTASGNRASSYGYVHWGFCWPHGETVEPDKDRSLRLRNEVLERPTATKEGRRTRKEMERWIKRPLARASRAE